MGNLGDSSVEAESQNEGGVGGGRVNRIIPERVGDGEDSGGAGGRRKNATID